MNGDQTAHRAVIKRAAHKLSAAILKVLLNDKVRPFIWLYYIPLWLWGLCASFFGWPTSYVRPVMGHVAYDLWIWTCLVATTVVMIGLQIEDEHLTPAQSRPSYIGVSWQTGGHACMFGVLLCLEISAVYMIPWGDPSTVLIFLISPYVVGCLLLAAQGIARMFSETLQRHLQ